MVLTAKSMMVLLSEPHMFKIINGSNKLVLFINIFAAFPAELSFEFQELLKGFSLALVQIIASTADGNSHRRVSNLKLTLLQEPRARAASLLHRLEFVYQVRHFPHLFLFVLMLRRHLMS